MSISVENLNKSFLQGVEQIQVIQNLNLKIDKPEVVAVIGQSGSGKSTFLSLLSGLDRADSGKVLIAGKDISIMSEESLTQFRAEHVSLVFQQYHLVQHLTALENVLLPLEIQGKFIDLKAAETLLEQVGLQNRMNHFPSQLSGGESQRVAIARALIVKPSVLLADEPSGNLDVATGSSVMDLFLDVVKKNKITTIVVTHNPELAKRCDRVFELIQGQLVAK
ncbi:MAG: ABC transporter ATP-binding protein [Pseudobdellovibrionaceae bacterium]